MPIPAAVGYAAITIGRLVNLVAAAGSAYLVAVRYYAIGAFIMAVIKSAIDAVTTEIMNDNEVRNIVGTTREDTSDMYSQFQRMVEETLILHMQDIEIEVPETDYLDDNSKERLLRNFETVLAANLPVALREVAVKVKKDPSLLTEAPRLNPAIRAEFAERLASEALIALKELAKNV